MPRSAFWYHPDVAVLITGLGYLGVPLAAELLRRGEQVVGLENFFCTPRSAVRLLRASPGFSLVEGSVSSRRALQRAFASAEVSLVYHLAAQPSAHPQAATVAYTERTNLVGPRLLLDALPRDRRCVVVLGSSFRVYGDLPSDEVTEETCYGRMADLAHLSKIYAEKLLELYAHRDGFAAVALRLGVVYGLGPCMKLDRRFMTVPNLFCQQAAQGEPLRVFAGAARPTGFIHLRDAVSALLEAPRLARPGFRAVNAAAELLGVDQVAELVARRAAARGLRVSIERDGSVEPRPTPRVASSLAEIGFRPTRAMADSLDELLDYFAAAAGRPPIPPAPASPR